MSEVDYDAAEAEAAAIDEAIRMVEAENTENSTSDESDTPADESSADEEESDTSNDEEPDDSASTEDETSEEESTDDEPDDSAEKVVSSKETKELVEKLEKSWAMIDKREADLRGREQDMKTQLQEIQKVSEFIKEVKEDPYSNLDKLGITYEGWTERILSDKDNPDTVRTEREKKELLARIEASEKKQQSFEEQAKADANQAALNAYYEQIQEAAQDEKFELVRAQNATKEALQYAELWFDEHQEVLEPAKAVEAIENYLKEELKSTMETKYAKELLNPKKKSDKKKTDAEKDKKKTGTNKSTKTLTGQLDTSVSQKKNAPEHITEEERIKEALRVFDSIE